MAAPLLLRASHRAASDAGMGGTRHRSASLAVPHPMAHSMDAYNGSRQSSSVYVRVCTTSLLQTMHMRTSSFSEGKCDPASGVTQPHCAISIRSRSTMRKTEYRLDANSAVWTTHCRVFADRPLFAVAVCGRTQIFNTRPACLVGSNGAQEASSR
eukprot:6203970-Pleurochrysis_carterae.AAC.2